MPNLSIKEGTEENGLSAYDAAYVWIADLLKAPLATFDATLATAARARLAGR